MKAVFTSEVTQVSFLYFHHIKLFKYCILHVYNYYAIYDNVQ